MSSEPRPKKERARRPGKKKKTPLQAFGQRLQELRRARNLAQEDVAQQLGKAQTLVGLYEAGEIKDPSPDTLRQMADIYRVDYSALLRPLIREKYNVNPDHLFQLKTDLGAVHSNPHRIIQDILGKVKHLLQGWFFLAETDTHRDPLSNPYYTAVKELLKHEVTLRFWIADQGQRKASEKTITTQLLADGLSARLVNEYLRYENDSALIQRLFRTELMAPEPDSNTVASADLTGSRTLNEVYFLPGKPQTVTSEDLLAYWTLPGENPLEGILIDVRPDLAFKRFAQLRGLVAGLDANAAHPNN